VAEPAPPPGFNTKLYNRVIAHYASLRGAAPHLTHSELATLRMLLDGKNRYQKAYKRLRALYEGTGTASGGTGTNESGRSSGRSRSRSRSSSSSSRGGARRSIVPLTVTLTAEQQAEEAALLAELAQTKHFQGELKRFGLALAKRAGALPRTWMDRDPLTPLPPEVPDAVAALERAAAQQVAGGQAELERRGARLAGELHAKQRQRQQSGGGRGGAGGDIAGWRGRLELLVQDAQALEASGSGGGRRASWLSAYGDAAGVSFSFILQIDLVEELKQKKFPSSRAKEKSRGDKNVLGIRLEKKKFF
jgi:hypothetical protein